MVSIFFICHHILIKKILQQKYFVGTSQLTYNKGSKYMTKHRVVIGKMGIRYDDGTIITKDAVDAFIERANVEPVLGELNNPDLSDMTGKDWFERVKIIDPKRVTHSITDVQVDADGVITAEVTPTGDMGNRLSLEDGGANNRFHYRGYAHQHSGGTRDVVELITWDLFEESEL